MTTVSSFSRKPRAVEAAKLSEDTTELVHIAKWCDGLLVMKFDEDELVEHGTYIRIPAQDGNAADAGLGDYIIKMPETMEADSYFVVSPADAFESDYQTV